MYTRVLVRTHMLLMGFWIWLDSKYNVLDLSVILSLSKCSVKSWENYTCDTNDNMLWFWAVANIHGVWNKMFMSQGLGQCSRLSTPSVTALFLVYLIWWLKTSNISHVCHHTKFKDLKQVTKHQMVHFPLRLKVTMHMSLDRCFH